MIRLPRPRKKQCRPWSDCSFLGKQCRPWSNCSFLGKQCRTRSDSSFLGKQCRTRSDCSLLLLKEQSDQGLHCLAFSLHLLDTVLYVKKGILFKSYSFFLFVGWLGDCPIFADFTIIKEKFFREIAKIWTHFFRKQLSSLCIKGNMTMC